MSEVEKKRHIAAAGRALFRRVGFEDWPVRGGLGLGKEGRHHNRAASARGRDTQSRVLRSLLSSLRELCWRWKRAAAGVRAVWGVHAVCSQASPCLCLLAVQLIGFFHNLGLHFCICNIMYYTHYRKIWNSDYKKRKFCTCMSLPVCQLQSQWCQLSHLLFIYFL